MMQQSIYSKEADVVLYVGDTLELLHQIPDNKPFFYVENQNEKLTVFMEY